ncbi:MULTISPECIES: ceramidase domain-containing protein [Pseudooceanicola]|uniref:ceramidase domain-containing protein n=1 Tax=Pseudooceanicola TaxID=1679449 RepID=UPI0028805FAD|nr:MULTISPECIES: ceramidase domain-containing protein [Pseudooceanicola]
MNGYCERASDPGLWAEPLNAATNVAFLIAAAAMWAPARDLPPARLLCAILALIGLGSGLYHTLATPWAALADTLPILAFILAYLYIATRDFLDQSRAVATTLTLLMVPAMILTAPLFALLPLYGASAAYMPVPVLIAVYAVLMIRRDRGTALNLALGAGLLLLSLTFRSLDGPLCAATHGIGTHLLWHLTNAVLLAWMIGTYLRHMLASVPPGR